MQIEEYFTLKCECMCEEMPLHPRKHSFSGCIFHFISNFSSFFASFCCSVFCSVFASFFASFFSSFFLCQTFAMTAQNCLLDTDCLTSLHLEHFSSQIPKFLFSNFSWNIFVPQVLSLNFSAQILVLKFGFKF